MRVICERSGSTPKGHAQRQHERRDQQRYTPLHLLSPPLAHSPQHHRPKVRRMEGEAHSVAPPLLLCRGRGSLFRALSVVTPPPFGSPATSLEERGPWALRPHLAAGLPLSRRRSARAHVNYRTNLEEGDIYAEWPFIWSQAGLLYARWLFRKRTSQNAGRANFLEIRQCEVRILGILGSSANIEDQGVGNGPSQVQRFCLLHLGGYF